MNNKETQTMKYAIGMLMPVVLLGLSMGGCSHSKSDISIQKLRCEYLANPLGIDVVKPRLGWTMGSEVRGQKQTAYQILVASSREKLADGRGDLWDTGRVESSQSNQVVYGGKELTSRRDCWWKVRVWDKENLVSSWSEPARWTMGLLAPADWQGQWICADWPGDEPKDKVWPLPWLRKDFELAEKPRQALVYISALGYYELYVNGEKAGDAVLTPAVSDYSKRALYLTHDISDKLVQGQNCIALWLGRGWNSQQMPIEVYNNPPVRAQAEITLAGGQMVQVATDLSWKSHPSPIVPVGRMLFGDYGGEQYDSRQEMPGWNRVGLDEAGWQGVRIMDAVAPRMAAQMMPPNRIQETIEPAAVEELADGVYQIDMGRNYVGWFALKIRNGQAGQTVRIEYGDKIFPDGRLQSYSQRDEYILGDAPEQTFCQRFNYHAFRWVRISGLTARPEPADARGYFIHTDYEPVSEFSCSNELLNWIYQTVNRTYRCLTIGGYVVDCPHRERLGYGGDSGTSVETAMMNFDVAPYYTKWLADWRDTQDPNTGEVPHTAPPVYAAGGGPAWGGVCVTFPWELYRYYGDTRILEISYPTIQKWLAFLETKTKDQILEPYIAMGQDSLTWSFLGDWVAPGYGQGPETRVDDVSTLLFNNCYYLYNVQLAAKIAAVLGKKEDAAAYEAKSQTLKQAIHARFYNAEKQIYANGEQAYLTMPLLFGVVPDELKAGVMNRLVEDIEVTRKGHLHAGIHGMYFMFKLFSRENREDLLYQMVNQTTFPGWGFMREQGATTIWEEWNGDNSQIHDTLLSAGSWFLSGPGGIRPDDSRPGFQHFIIKPALVGDLTSAQASYDSLYGTIRSRWEKKGDSFSLEVQVPVNATATVYIPAAKIDAVKESGRPAAVTEAIQLIRRDHDYAVYRVGSGTYRFEK